MSDRDKTKEQLIKELADLRSRVAELQNLLVAGDRKEEELSILKKSLETISTGVTIADTEGRIIYTNPAEAEMHGYEVGELIGKNVSIFVPDKNRKKLTLDDIAGWKEWTREVQEVRKDGSCFPALLKSVPVKGTDEKPAYIISLSEDITERKRMESALQESEERYRSLVETTDDSIYLVDRDCKYLFVNRKHRERLGISRDQYLGRTYGEFHTHEETKWFVEKVHEVFDTGRSYHCEHRSKRDGRYFFLTLSPVKAREGNTIAVNVISKNITELKRLQDELRALSLTDDLTGLYNRRGFYTLVEQQLKMANRLKKGIYLLFADVNNLKAVNDRFGHREGDKLLVETANLLRENYRNSDIIARIGGDEFVIIPIDRLEGSAEVITSRLNRNIETYNTRRKHDYALSISVGTAYYDPENPCSVEELLLQADKSMYKQKGHNQEF